MTIPGLRRPSVLFACLLASGLALAQGPVPPDLDAWVGRATKDLDIPGVSVAIVKDGKVATARGYGVKKLGESKAVGPNTLFAIASNTKAFTAAALATLVDEGKIGWDDPVHLRLPGFQMYDHYVSKELTIRDLLTHRCGLGLGQGDLLFWPQTTFKREDLVHRMRFMKPASSLRSRFAYHNLAYVAAGQIIPAVTGKSWETYVRERIFVPLEMNETKATAEFLEGDDFAWPHSRLGSKKTEPCALVMGLDNAGPAGSILSSAADMAKWMLLQLNRGKFLDKEGRLFSEKEAREMWSAQTVLPIRDLPGPLAALQPRFSSYGLGWFLRDYRGRKMVTHTGGAAGYLSRVMLVPEENLGIVILTNAEESGAYDAILYHVLDHAFQLPPTNWIAALRQARDVREKEAAETEAKAASTRVAGSKPSLGLERYAGSYDDAWYGRATIRFEGGKLVLSMDHTPTMVGELEHWQYDTFKTHWRDRTIENAFVTFALQPDGTIEQFKMAAVSPLADFSFDYQDLLFRPAK